jgi:DNA-directed RNA polymerase subunit K/omega
MSDDEDNFSMDDSSIEETTKIFTKNKNTIDDYEEEDDIIEEETSDNEDDDIPIQIGGLNSLEEGEIEEDDEEENSDNDSNDDNEEEIGEPDENNLISNKPKQNKIKSNIVIESDDEEEEDDDDLDENYLKKFDSEINKNYIAEFHPECIIQNYEEISILTKIVKDNNNIIIDPLHKTIPFLTKYEKARVLGQRSKQIETGSKPFVPVPENVIDSYIIAELELQQKKIPFIIKRPLPSGGSEYWNLKDLELIHF